MLGVPPDVVGYPCSDPVGWSESADRTEGYVVISNSSEVDLLDIPLQLLLLELTLRIQLLLILCLALLSQSFFIQITSSNGQPCSPFKSLGWRSEIMVVLYWRYFGRISPGVSLLEVSCSWSTLIVANFLWSVEVGIQIVIVAIGRQVSIIVLLISLKLQLQCD